MTKICLHQDEYMFCIRINHHITYITEIIINN